LALAEAEQENRLLRARNERLERELAENARELGLDYEPAPVQPAHISPKQLLALAQEANLGLDKVIEVFRIAAPVQEPIGYAVPTFDFDNSVIKKVHYAGTVPLYTTPPAAQRQWVGLTDEERNECTQSPFTADQHLAIEAKLKEKNT